MSSKKNTPMMEQYLSIKAAYPDTILFYRMGDFYEMFNEDAEKASAILEIALTSRNKNDANPIPMCGIPFRAADNYIARLIENGCKVAVCEQVENAAEVKGLVKREVVRVVTPGMILNESLLDQSSNNFLLAVSSVKNTAALACLDISTGTFRTCQVEKPGNSIPAALVDEALKLDPSEIILPQNFETDPQFASLRRAFSGRQISFLPASDFRVDDARERLTQKFKTRSLEGFGIERMDAAVSAAGAVVSYVQETQMQDTDHIYQISAYDLDQFLIIDDRSCRNLELLQNIQNRDKKGSLISVLDKTVTAMGGRLMKNWIRHPLIDPDPIQERLNAIEELTDAGHAHQAITGHLKSVYDLERLGSKIAMGQGNARDLLSLKNSLQKLPAVFAELATFQSPLLNASHLEHSQALLGELGELADLIHRAIREDAVHTLNDGGLIKDGYNEELDELLAISRDGKSWIAKAEATEKQTTGLSSLKIKYNKVFGYFIEVSKAQSASVPEHYVRKQTLVNAERFITDEMKKVESTILNAQDKRNSLEYAIFSTIRDQVTAKSVFILRAATFVARVDVLQGLATAALENNYVKPEICKDRRLSITEGRHPVVEKLIQGERYVPNSIAMDDEKNQVLLITGPNMAGKSTVLRQVALTVLMAQMGSFVPAQAASIGLVDRIFTRVGALDNLSSGQSTFMVEMEETANIVNNATENSLVILDEIGRGTSTFDGMSIAWAVAEYLHNINGLGVKTLFATHYHEMTRLEELLPRVKNFNIAVKEFKDNIVFLRRLVEGGTNKSYGIQVARLAGVPDPIIQTAKTVLSEIETQNTHAGTINGTTATPAPTEPKAAPSKKARKAPKQDPGQLELFAPKSSPVLEMLDQADISNMTPLQALNLLNEMKSELKKESCI